MTNEKKILSLPTRQRREAQAAEWVTKLDADTVSAIDRARFDQWMSSSEKNRECYYRIAKAWSALDDLEELQHLAESDDVAELLKQNRRQSRKIVQSIGAMAAMLIIGFSTWVALPYLNTQTYKYEAFISTAVGEMQNIQLPDGSLIKANTNTHLEIHYSKNSRDINLLRGEAFFEVAHAPDRPFSVVAGDRQVRAVGTAFNVRLREAKLAVTVEEGRVALINKKAMLVQNKNPENNAAQELTQISAGQRAVFDTDIEELEVLQAENLQRRLSWRNGILSFSGEPLSFMISEVSRYSNVEIEIADESLKDMPVAGYFKVGEVDAMLEVLDLMSDVTIERIDQNKVRLTKK